MKVLQIPLIYLKIVEMKDWRDSHVGDAEKQLSSFSSNKRFKIAS